MQEPLFYFLKCVSEDFLRVLISKIVDREFKGRANKKVFEHITVDPVREIWQTVDDNNIVVMTDSHIVAQKSNNHMFGNLHNRHEGQDEMLNGENVPRQTSQCQPF